MNRNRVSAGGQLPQPLPTRDRPQAAGGDSISHDSPARTLQGVLASRISDGFALEASDHVEKWPRHQRLLFLVGSASALWAVTIGIASIVAAVIR